MSINNNNKVVSFSWLGAMAHHTRTICLSLLHNTIIQPIRKVTQGGCGVGSTRLGVAPSLQCHCHWGYNKGWAGMGNKCPSGNGKGAWGHKGRAGKPPAWLSSGASQSLSTTAIGWGKAQLGSHWGLGNNNLSRGLPGNCCGVVSTEVVVVG